MNRKNNVFDTRLNAWQALVDNLKPHLADLPNLATDHGKLTDLIDQARTLQARQDIHLSSLRDVVTQRSAVAQQARKARNRLVAGLQSAFDHESDKLLEFGVKPRVRRIGVRLTPLQKAEKAAARAAARAAALAAKQPADGSGTPPPTAK